MKFLILGVSGMAGHICAYYLNEQGHQVTGFSRRKIERIPCIEGDAKDAERLEKIITEGQYDAVVNCIGVLNQFAEKNQESAVYLNAYLPHVLAKITKNQKTKIIHISTDCVFQGNTGGNTEKSENYGKTFYDRSKALGELKDEKNITIRTSIVGPDPNENGIGLFNWFMKQEELNGYTKAIWTGVTTLELAKMVEAAARQQATGLYNMVYKESISKYNLLKLFNHYICSDQKRIAPDDSLVLDKTLIRTKFEFQYEVRDYETQIREMAEWVKQHKTLYSHYDYVNMEV